LIELTRSGNLKIVEQKHGVLISNKLRLMMKKVGLEPEHFQQSGAQICEIGWLAESNPRCGLRQVETVLLVRRGEFIMLLSALSRMLSMHITNRNVREIWKQALENEIGEDCDFRTPVDRYIQMHLGLPVREKLLKYNLNDLSSLSAGELNQLQERLR